MIGDGTVDAVPVDLEVLDTKVRLWCAGSAGESLAKVVRHAWARCLVDGRPIPDVTLKVGTAPGPPGLDLVDSDVDRLMHQLSSLVTLRSINYQAGRMLMLHAAGLAHPESGGSIALVGPSGTGKTTAALGLGRQLGYLSDETVAVRADVTIAPYPKPLSVLPDDGSRVKTQVSPDDVGLQLAPDSCRLTAMVILARDGSTDAWLETLPLLESLARLAPESSYLARLERPLHRLADVIEEVGGVKVLHYTERDQLPGLVCDLIASAR
jgi:hypothetical protein